jgi:hypothetical protein
MNRLEALATALLVFALRFTNPPFGATLRAKRGRRPSCEASDPDWVGPPAVPDFLPLLWLFAMPLSCLSHDGRPCCAAFSASHPKCMRCGVFFVQWVRRL